MPLVSWAAPANRGDALFLRPSVAYCHAALEWCPDIVVGDMAYITLANQRIIRERWDVAVVTKLRPDMKLIPPFEPGPVAVCAQGQTLQWLGYESRDQLQWFGVLDAQPLCHLCGQQQSCPRQFGFPSVDHEILFGLIPLASRVAQNLLTRVRPWIEASQSYEKNQLGLSRFFLNSLRLTWSLCLLADAVCLLRAHAFLRRPCPPPEMYELTPRQLPLGLEFK